MFARSRILAKEIPIGSVARVMRMSVSGEADAMKVDEIVRWPRAEKLQLRWTAKWIFGGVHFIKFEWALNRM